jgi:hypothetical protein
MLERSLVSLFLALAAGCSSAPAHPDAAVGAQCGAIVCSAGQLCCPADCGGFHQFCWTGTSCPEDSCDMGGRD